MPTYVCTAQDGSLTKDQKAQIAAEITRVHNDVTGAPRFFVQVLFNDLKAGNQFIGGAPPASSHWELMFTRSLFGTTDMIAQHRLLTEAAELVDAGVIRTTFGEHFGRINAENLKRAHALLESGKAKGKIVLEEF
jgi:phenylpyruvate tautomerase PptA (4-oxalocrotonate tautomerase family)